MKTIKFLSTLAMLMLGLVAYSQPPTIHWAFIDNDLDGHGVKIRQITDAQVIPFLNAGYTVQNVKPQPDCDDNNDLVYHGQVGYLDNDGDKHVVGAGVNFCTNGTLPLGYITKAEILGWKDCDDGDASVWRNACVKQNACDIATTMCIGATPPAGWSECRDIKPCVTTKIDVYPNPAVSQIMVSSSELWNARTEIKVIDAFGHTVRSMMVPGLQKGQPVTLNTADLKPGIYKIVVQSGELLETRTIGVKL